MMNYSQDRQLHPQANLYCLGEEAETRGFGEGGEINAENQMADYASKADPLQEDFDSLASGL